MGYWKNEIANSYTKGPNTLGPTPDFCHSIEAAWEIVEKYPFLPDENDPKGLFFEIYRNENTYTAGWARYPECFIIEAEADTAPMAICKAFLKMP